MRVGNWVAYARSRSVILPNYISLLDAITGNKPQREELLDWLDMEISFGEIIDDKYWKIKHSILPLKVQLTVDYGSILLKNSLHFIQ